MSIVYFLIGFIGFFLVAALFVPRKYKVTRSIIINKPRQEVFDYMKYLRNHDEFSVWQKMDPNIKKSFEGTDGTLGFKCAWESNHKKVGVGHQTIAAINEGQNMVTDLIFIKPFAGKATAILSTTDAENGQTNVNWTFNSAMPYPFNTLRLVMNFDNMIGKDLAASLEGMKQQLEK
jgi:hypothetical protein